MRRDKNDFDLTPMIDVTFLILIFFMVTASMVDAIDAATIAGFIHFELTEINAELI